MPDVSARSLKILSAVVWYGGGVALLLKGGSLLIEANSLSPNQIWPWLALAVGISIGGVKATLLFSKSCRKNLDRITALERPKVWQFFRPWFFLVLTVMIVIGASLSRMAHGNYSFLIGVAVLDLSIACALLGSSYVFWAQRIFSD